MSNMYRFRPGLSSWDYGYDVHGIFLFTGGASGRSLPLFRIQPDGTLERLDLLWVNPAKTSTRIGDQTVVIDRRVLSGVELAQFIGMTYKDFEEVRRALGITGPALLAAGILNASGHDLTDIQPFSTTPRLITPGPPPLEDNRLFLRPRLETSDENLPRSFKDVADYFWNALGYPECHGIDQDGNPTPLLQSWQNR